uniref:Uncharacterized protein n=1 Tax=Romanomermis culicivorax TaxID=13658 RepID=A0A915KMS7_ROMCU
MDIDIASQKENNCTLSCLEEMDAAFNKTYNASSRSYWDDEKYDEKRLDKLCKARMFPEFQEAKQVFPCLNKLDQETTQKMCDPKCQIYKQALKKWETLRMTPEVVTDNFDELAAVFSKSCSYVKCEKDCSSPGIVNQCGNYGKLFMDSFWRTMLESLNNTTMIANMILNNSRLRGKSFPLCRN